MSFFRVFLLFCSLMIAIVATSLAAQSSPTGKTAVISTTAALNSGQRDQPLQLQYLGPDTPRECLKMRMYKVRRDDPQSDSTRLVNYSTCLPAARIQTYSVKHPVDVKMP
jgi:hypothetical protein